MTILPKFISKKDLETICFEDNSRIYDTSTNAPMANSYSHIINLSELSPFIQYGKIPIPGMKRKHSDTVEGIWQGLKIIKGNIDNSYFKGKGRIRKGKPEGHLFNNSKISYIQARKKIYTSAWDFVWENRIDESLKKKFIQDAITNIPQYFFDVDNNGDIFNKNEPYAHSAYIVELIKKDIKDYSSPIPDVLSAGAIAIGIS